MNTWGAGANWSVNSDLSVGINYTRYGATQHISGNGKFGIIAEYHFGGSSDNASNVTVGINNKTPYATWGTLPSTGFAGVVEETMKNARDKSEDERWIQIDLKKAEIDRSVASLNVEISAFNAEIAAYEKKLKSHPNKSIHIDTDALQQKANELQQKAKGILKNIDDTLVKKFGIKYNPSISPVGLGNLNTLLANYKKHIQHIQHLKELAAQQKENNRNHIDHPTDFSGLTTFTAGPVAGLEGTITDPDGVASVTISYNDGTPPSTYTNGNIDNESSHDSGTSYKIIVTDKKGNVKTSTGTL